MSNTLDDKNVQRKQRKAIQKERRNAIARALHAQPLRKINTQGLQILQQRLGLLPGSLKLDALDAIFIAIDFEYSHFSAKTGCIRIREVGIAMLDTRDISYKKPNNVISSQHYRTVIDTKQFIFGTSIDIEQDKLVDLLKRLLFPEDQGRKRARKLILVGHGFSFEIQALRGLGINLALAPAVEDIFDTHYLGLEVFGQDFSLSRLTRQTGIQGSHFHNAGNDANFTLRAMLLLAIHGFSEINNPQPSKLEIYKKIAQF